MPVPYPIILMLQSLGIAAPETCSALPFLLGLVLPRRGRPVCPRGVNHQPTSRYSARARFRISRICAYELLNIRTCTILDHSTYALVPLLYIVYTFLQSRVLFKNSIAYALLPLALAPRLVFVFPFTAE